MLFEELGFRYVGPVDGHDLFALREYLELVKDIQGPVLLHVFTEKGHGFQPACEDPVMFHAPQPFARERVLHLDRDIVVVDKPAGLQTVPWGDDDDALDRRLAAMLDRPVQVVHRLDRDTSGVMMFARTAAAFTHLEHQLRRHAVHRRYLAVAHGDVRSGTVRSFLAADRGDGLRGSIANAKLGQEAITHVEVVEPLRGATLVRCALETGRTHQIRIHLAERGHMLLGERGYLREHRGPALPAPRILLHAAELGFVHPTSGAPMRFEVPLPDDMAAVIAALRH